VAKERAKAEKLAKFNAKKAKQAVDKAAAIASNPAKEKKKEKKATAAELVPEYVEETPKGEKKREFLVRFLGGNQGARMSH